MSIAEKLQTIAENEQRVYDKGYSDGFNSAPPDLLPYLKYIDFKKVELPDNMRNVVLNVPQVEKFNSYQQFALNNATSITIICNACIELNQTFYNCKSLKSIEVIKENGGSAFSGSGGATFTFHGCDLLEEIIGEFDFSQSTGTNNPFFNCLQLKEMRWKPLSLSVAITVAQSPNLSLETIQSIFDGLATVETAQTLTLHANLKILQSQVDSANAKGWTVAGGTVVSEEEYYG